MKAKTKTYLSLIGCLVLVLAGATAIISNPLSIQTNREIPELRFDKVVYERENNFLYLEMYYMPNDNYEYLLPIANYERGHEYIFGSFDKGQIIYAINNPASIENQPLTHLDIFAQNYNGEKYLLVTLTHADLTKLMEDTVNKKDV